MVPSQSYQLPTQKYQSGCDFKLSGRTQVSVEDTGPNSTSAQMYSPTIHLQMASPESNTCLRRSSKVSEPSRNSHSSHTHLSGAVVGQVMLPPIRHLFTDLIPQETDVESSSNTLDAVSPFRSVTGTPSSRITAQSGGLSSYTHSPFRNPATPNAPIITRGDESYLSLRSMDHLKGRLPAVSTGAGPSNVLASGHVQTPSRDHRPPPLAPIIREPAGSSSSTEDESDSSSSCGDGGAVEETMGVFRNSVSVGRNSFSDRRTSEYSRYLDAQLSTPQSNVLYRSESPMTSVSGYGHGKVKSAGRNLTSPCFSILSPRDFSPKSGGYGDSQSFRFGTTSSTGRDMAFSKGISKPLVSPICIGTGKSRRGKGNTLKHVDNTLSGDSSARGRRKSSVGKVPKKPQTTIDGSIIGNSSSGNGRAGLKCLHCGEVDTPEWRRGPYGSRTLCNACGLYYRKLIKKFNPKNANLIMRYNRMVYPLDRRIPVSASVPQHVIDKLNNDVTLDSDYYSVGGATA